MLENHSKSLISLNIAGKVSYHCFLSKINDKTLILEYFGIKKCNKTFL